MEDALQMEREAVEAKEEEDAPKEEDQEDEGGKNGEEEGEGEEGEEGKEEQDQDLEDMQEAAEAIMAAGRMLPPPQNKDEDEDDEDEDENADLGEQDMHQGRGGEGRGMLPLSEAAILADSLLKAQLEVGGIYSFNAKEAALCKLHGWENVRECSIKRVTSTSVFVACKTTTSSPANDDEFFGSYRIPASTALRVLGSRGGERGESGGGASLAFPSGGAARKKAAAAAATAAAEVLSSGGGGRGLPQALTIGFPPPVGPGRLVGPGAKEFETQL
jgi:hypothetical protein